MNIKKSIKSKVFISLCLIIWALSGVFTLFALRENNKEMLRLRDEVFLADKNDSNLDEALRRLQLYVTTHMNTSLPKVGDGKAIQLKYSYDRRVAEEQSRFQQETARVSQAAKLACGASVNELARVECEQKYIKSNPVQPAIEILPEQYSVEFVSPIFSFDRAGWSILVFAASSLIIIFDRFINLLKKRSKG